MTDVALIETGNGGDLTLKGQDIALQGGWGNMPYLAMFGGNLEADTIQDRIATEQAFDWWGNNLLMENEPGNQFNSLTERTLNEVALTSAGRSAIEQSVKSDLAFMREFAEISVSVSIISDDRIKIDIKVQQPENLQGRIDDVYKQYIFIWDATKKMLGDWSVEDFDRNDFYI